MPHTCCGVSLADSGAPETSDAESVMAISKLARESRPRQRRPDSLDVLTRDFLDAGNQFVHRLVHRNFLADHAVHRLGPDVLVVQDGELPVLGEVERRGAAGELIVDRLAMAVSLPERALLARNRDREPAAERALDIGADVLF